MKFNAFIVRKLVLGVAFLSLSAFNAKVVPLYITIFGCAIGIGYIVYSIYMAKKQA